MKNVLFVIPFLGKTGAERVVYNLVNNIDRSKYTPFIVLYAQDDHRNSLLKELNKNVTVEYLNVRGRARYNFHRILFGLKSICQKHRIDTLLISDGTANAFVSPFLFLFGHKIKKIARESNLPSLYEKNKIAKVLYSLCYKNYDAIIAQSDDMFNDLTGKMGLPEDKVIKINNPLDLKKIRRDMLLISEFELPKNKINLLTIGRLTYQKGFDILLKAFSSINYNNYHLTIVGNGEDRAKLHALAEQYSLNNNVTFIEEVDNPYSLMKQADIFISCSRWEGYPNVVIEALACGIPVLANNYPGGIGEIINNGINGIVCDISCQLESALESISQLSPVIFDEEPINNIFRMYEGIY
ncbi:glycosyltransferase (plasmid) [Klebsiella pneumoniae]